MTPAAGILVMVLCLGGAFLSSGLEAGVFALNRLRVRQLARKGNRRAVVLARFLDEPEDFLWTLFVGNTVCGMTAVGLCVWWWHYWTGGWPASFWGGTAVLLFLFYALFDLFPKVLYRTYPNRLCLMSVLPLRVLRVFAWPLVGISRGLGGLLRLWGGADHFTGRLFRNREELKQVMLESSHGFTTEERAMINRILDVETLAIGRITIPLEKTMSVTTSMSMAQVMEVYRTHGFTRMPVWEESDGRRRVAGVLSLRRILFAGEFEPKRTAGEFVRPALYLDEDQRLGAAMSRMQQSGERLAIVLSRDRREVGIVSLQDLLRAMFGDLNL